VLVKYVMSAGADLGFSISVSKRIVSYDSVSKYLNYRKDLERHALADRMVVWSKLEVLESRAI
jgi:hypothetical protein